MKEKFKIILTNENSFWQKKNEKSLEIDNIPGSEQCENNH